MISSVIISPPSGIIKAAGNLASEASVLTELLGMHMGLGCAQQCAAREQALNTRQPLVSILDQEPWKPRLPSQDVVQQPEPLGELGNLYALDPAKQ